jgi:tRNA-dihydrouridine synthase A
MMIAKNTYEQSIRLSVAPMMDWTDRHCRVFHRLLAPNARLYTEMVHAQAVIYGDRERLLGFDGSEHPLALQLGGSHAEHLAQACKIAQDYGYDEVNLNVGCPSDRVQAGRFGACLMKEPMVVAECIQAMQQAVSIPVTVKCRLGVDEHEDYDYFLEFIDAVAHVGCSEFIVHARKAWLNGLSPKENREIPPLRYDWVYRLKAERPNLRIVLNGGLREIDQCHDALHLVNGVMIGRAAFQEPYQLHLMQVALFNTALMSRSELLLQMEPYVRDQLHKGVALKHISKCLLGLFHAQPGGRLFRQILSEFGPKADADWSVILQALKTTQMDCPQ